MAWTKPQSVSNATKVKDADDIIEYNMQNMEAYVNGVDDGITTPAYSPTTGLTANMVDKTTIQTITAAKTFSGGITANVTGTVTDGVTLNGTQTLTNKTITTPLGIVKSDVGLANVDNTSDLAKPISTATQTALDGKSATSHTHVFSEVTAKPTTISGYGITDAYTKTELDAVIIPPTVFQTVSSNISQPLTMAVTSTLPDFSNSHTSNIDPASYINSHPVFGTDVPIGLYKVTLRYTGAQMDLNGKTMYVRLNSTYDIDFPELSLYINATEIQDNNASVTSKVDKSITSIMKFDYNDTGFVQFGVLSDGYVSSGSHDYTVRVVYERIE